jgi:hypothetical protein
MQEALSPELVLVAPARLRHEAILELPMFELWRPAPLPAAPTLWSLVGLALLYFVARLAATMVTMAAIALGTIAAIVVLVLLTST